MLLIEPDDADVRLVLVQVERKWHRELKNGGIDRQVEEHGVAPVQRERSTSGRIETLSGLSACIHLRVIQSSSGRARRWEEWRPAPAPRPEPMSACQCRR